MTRWPWRRERDLNEVIASHLAMAVEDRRADGTPAHDAHIAAHREFGNVALGVFAVVASSVGQCAREIGIRMAIGARGRETFCK